MDDLIISVSKREFSFIVQINNKYFEYWNHQRNKFVHDLVCFQIDESPPNCHLPFDFLCALTPDFVYFDKEWKAIEVKTSNFINIEKLVKAHSKYKQRIKTTIVAVDFRGVVLCGEPLMIDEDSLLHAFKLGKQLIRGIRMNWRKFKSYISSLQEPIFDDFHIKDHKDTLKQSLIKILASGFPIRRMRYRFVTKRGAKSRLQGKIDDFFEEELDLFAFYKLTLDKEKDNLFIDLLFGNWQYPNKIKKRKSKVKRSGKCKKFFELF
jgi:hypothetical protein